MKPSRLSRFFTAVVAARFWIVAVYAVLLVPSTWFALKVHQDNSLDRLIVRSDPDHRANQQFEDVFGRGEYVLLLAEAEQPFAPDVLRRLDALERRLAGIPKVQVNSALSAYRRAKGGFDPTPEGAEAFQKFAVGTTLFREQGLVGDRSLAMALVLDVRATEERQQVVTAIDAALADLERDPRPLTGIHKLGEPYVNAYLDRDSRATATQYFPLFTAFVVLLTVGLYRSLRTVIAFLISLGVAAALTVGFVGATGGDFTLVSSLVPMTVLITCTATLVYLQSRFVDRPADRPVDEHQIFALENKFAACTASIFATAAGFAALYVSKIRPIREMGLWVAIGLGFTWVVVFTLFPALQRILRTPTRAMATGHAHEAGSRFARFTAWLPRWSYHWRWTLVPGSLALCAVGAGALFGVPGWLEPMSLQTNALEYIPHKSTLYRDTKQLEAKIPGLAVTELWLSGRFGAVTDADVVRGFDELERAIAADPRVGSVFGPGAMVRSIGYAATGSDRIPGDDKALESLTAALESKLPTDPVLLRFVDKALGQTHLTIITKSADYRAFVAIQKMIDQRWREAVTKTPALKGFSARIVGRGPLQAKIAHDLVPTLVESFGITVLIIFGTFLVVFRNGAARLMALIPSLFAILVMFLFMRVVGMTLNIATILIASTVLGTSENDQIHFFFHFLERQKEGGTTEESLAHTLRVAGRAIITATLINAGGFFAFALAELPPVRQFGILSAVAFLLSMLADFTALPAALWMVFRERPVESAPVKAERPLGGPASLEGP
jgi:predicted RND superfamily exporter protein